MTLRADLKAAFEASEQFTWSPQGDIALGSLPVVIGRYGGTGPDQRPITELIVLTGSLLSKDPYLDRGRETAEWIERARAVILTVADAYPDELPVAALHNWSIPQSENQFVGAMIRVLGS